MVIVDDLDIERVTIAPDKTDPPLVIDANTVLARTIARQTFQAIARRNAQIVQSGRAVKHSQLASGDSLNLSRQPS